MESLILRRMIKDYLLKEEIEDYCLQSPSWSFVEALGELAQKGLIFLHIECDHVEAQFFLNARTHIIPTVLYVSFSLNTKRKGNLIELLLRYS